MVSKSGDVFTGVEPKGDFKRKAKQKWEKWGPWVSLACVGCRHEQSSKLRRLAGGSLVRTAGRRKVLPSQYPPTTGDTLESKISAITIIISLGQSSSSMAGDVSQVQSKDNGVVGRRR
jgi:hypothetical protein